MSEGDDGSLLAQARRAWRDWRSAGRTVERLRAYKRMTPGMKDDFNNASKRHYEAERTLERILGRTDK